jgi:hypothetical protein
VAITNNNFRGLSLLCEEFRFADLMARLSQFQNSVDFNANTQISKTMRDLNRFRCFSESVFRFAAKVATCECSVGQAVALSPAVRDQLSVDACARTFALKNVCDVDSVRLLLSNGAVSIVGSQTRLGMQFCNPGLELSLAGTDLLDFDALDLSMFSVEALDEILASSSFSIGSENDLLKRVLALGEEYRPLLTRINVRFLDADGLSALAEHLTFPTECVWSEIVDSMIRHPSRHTHHSFPSGWHSVIVSVFPEIFANLSDKTFSLLWRGSRDGFDACDFHRRCDGHPNTLTLILDTDGNVFGGFTPVQWESRQPRSSGNGNCVKADPSQKSFLFTLVNPHKVPARRFELKAKEKDNAIICSCNYGPNFSDIGVWNVSEHSKSWSYRFGFSYTNDTGLNGNTFFTGSGYFQVKEIEVFEIKD